MLTHCIIITDCCLIVIHWSSLWSTCYPRKFSFGGPAANWGCCAKEALVNKSEYNMCFCDEICVIVICGGIVLELARTVLLWGVTDILQCVLTAWNCWWLRCKGHFRSILQICCCCFISAEKVRYSTWFVVLCRCWQDISKVVNFLKIFGRDEE